MNIRPYEEADAKEIVTWSKDQISLHKWCADTFDHFPITPEEFHAYYCSEECKKYITMTVTENEKPVGHYFLCFTDENRKTIRFCFVITDPLKRGNGYGTKLMRQAVRHTFDSFDVDRITLGVFENNPIAYRCYKAVGFRDVVLEKMKTYRVMNEDWNCLEMKIERAEFVR